MSLPYKELLRRIERADDAACDGMSSSGGKGCPFCKLVVEYLRGGDIHCPTCRHINAIGHSCADWAEYDEGCLSLEGVDERWKARDSA